ncbi:MAG: carbohydrate-binding family 9-like protein [Mucinivorans sp.]
MLNIPKITCHCRRELQKPRVNIACNNWPSEYPYAPSANFSVAHDSDALYIRFRVIEDCAMALVSEDQGPVWTDSAVEFFISFDDTGYYNFEFNCIGRALLAFRKQKPSPTVAPPEVMAIIERDSTLGGECFAERFLDTGDRVNWELNVKIPREAFFKHKIETLDGLMARGNFYKCGDNLSKPHYLSWNPIDTPTPNFHVEQFFGDLAFE